MSTEQHCCSADCPAEGEQEDEDAVAHKVATVHDHILSHMCLLCMVTCVICMPAGEPLRQHLH